MRRALAAFILIGVVLACLAAANLRRDPGALEIDWRLLKPPPREVTTEPPTRGEIASLIFRQGGVWMAVGLAVGSVGVVFVGRFLRTQLFGVPELDPLAIGAAVSSMAATSST